MANFGNLYDYVTARGIVIPQTSDIKAKVEQAFREIFGSDFSLAPETTNGRLIEAVTVLFTDVCGVGAQIANGLNVTQAVGEFIDGLGALFGVVRVEGESDASFRRRIVASASRGSGFAQSIANEIMKVNGVHNVCVLDNGNEDPDVLPKNANGEPTSHSVAVPGHTVFISVWHDTVGLETIRTNIAKAIMRTKSAGCSMDDTVRPSATIEKTVVVDGTSFTAKFCFAQEMFLNIHATVDASYYTGTDAASDTENAIKSVFADNSMNATVTKAQLSAAIAAKGNGLVAVNIVIDWNYGGLYHYDVDSLDIFPCFYVDASRVVVDPTVL